MISFSRSVSQSTSRTVSVDALDGGEPLCGEKKGTQKWTDAKILENRVLTDPVFLEDDREVRHMTLDVSAADRASVLHSYTPGDVLHVLPRSPPSAVDAFLHLTGLDGDADDAWGADAPRTSACARRAGWTRSWLPCQI